MNLKETWNRIAFGANSTGQKSGLLREFKDESDPDQFQSLAQPEDEGPMNDPEPEFAYTLEGLEKAKITLVPAQEYGKYLSQIQALPKLATMTQEGDSDSASPSKPASMEESTFRTLKSFIEPDSGIWNLLKENGTWGGNSNPSQGGGLINGNAGGNSRNHGGAKGVAYTLDAMFGGKGGKACTITPKKANEIGQNITFSITPVHANWSYPVTNPGVNCFPGTGKWSDIGQLAGSDDAFCCAIEDYWSGSNNCVPPYNKSSVWEGPNSHPDVQFKGQDYELKGATTAKNLTYNAAGDWEKDFKYQLEASKEGIATDKKNHTISDLVSQATNPMTEYILANIATSTKEQSLIVDFAGNAQGSWCKGKTTSAKFAEAKKLKTKIANHLKNAQNSAAFWPIWQSVEGVGSAGSVAQYILCVQYAEGNIGVIPPSQYTGGNPPGVWKVGLYNNVSCRPMIGFAFTPYTGAACSPGALDDVLGY